MAVYGADWTTGTMHMSLEEEAAYWRLVLYARFASPVRGCIPDDEKRQAVIVRVPRLKWRSLSNTVLAKFSKPAPNPPGFDEDFRSENPGGTKLQTPPGWLVHSRVVEEIDKANQFSSMQSDKGTKSAKARSAKTSTAVQPEGNRSATQPSTETQPARARSQSQESKDFRPPAASTLVAISGAPAGDGGEAGEAGGSLREPEPNGSPPAGAVPLGGLHAMPGPSCSKTPEELSDEAHRQRERLAALYPENP